MTDWSGGSAWVRDMAGNVIRVATLTEEEARVGGGGVTVTGSQGGSVAASTLSMPGLVADLGSGVAAVGALFSLIGPLNITFDQADWENVNSVLLIELPEGTALIRTWLEAVTPWNGAAPGDYIGIGLGGSGLNLVDPDAGDEYDDIIHYDAIATDVPISVTGVAQEAAPAGGAVPVAARITSGPGGLVAFTDGFAAGTAGESNIWAVVATPAS